MNKTINRLKLTFEELQIYEINDILNIESEQNISILTQKIILDEFKSNTSKYYVVKYNSEIIGYINISILVDNVDINSIVVKKDYQRNGIATYMLENIFNKCKDLNINKILLEVRKSNIIAQNLYQKLGFKKIYTRKKYYPDNLEDAYIYRKLI